MSFSKIKSIGIKTITTFVAIAVLFSTFSANIFAIEPKSEDDSYETYLSSQGFPKSYWDDLTTLHNKYPNWTFKAFKTGLDFSTAVAGERSYHSKQLIYKTASNSFKCNCSNCYKNGNYIAQEGSNWVSASREAVEYYLDPRNFLNEKYIFQFESTSYDETQNSIGVESIIKNTWMKNSNITYSNVNGNIKTIDEKYSEVILDAAKNSSMSAYYLASKIVQEVGDTKATAGGASGTYGNYSGIFNYYNIGAYTGATDGLNYANGYMKTNAKTTLYKSANTSSTKLVTIPNGTTTYYNAKSGDFYRVSVVIDSKKYIGYVLKSNISMSTSYSRAWTNPQKSIMNGALWIKNSFSTYQNTGYLQKFNVNSASGNLYSHEYMANVEAAASEGKTTYNAYVGANILSNSNTFLIPVFNNMPGDDITKETPTVAISSYGRTSIELKWNEIGLADGYVIYRYNYSTNEYVRIGKVTSGNTFTDSNLATATTYKYRVRAYMKDGNGTHWSQYSEYVKASTTPGQVTFLKKETASNTSITLQWSRVEDADGYRIYRYSSSTGNYKYIKEISNNSTVTYKNTGLEKGTTYKYRIRAYTLVGTKHYFGSYSSKVAMKTSGYATKKGMVTTNSLKVRKSASSSATTLVKIAEYKFVEIIDETTNWYKISFSQNGKSYTGYVLKDYIKIVYNGTVNASSLNIRKSNSTSSAIITKLLKGKSVKIIGTSGDWYKIRFTDNGKTQNGYAAKQYINQMI